MDSDELPLTQHLDELRNCIIKAGVGIIIGFVLCYTFSEQIVHYLSLPLFDILPDGQQKLYFTNPLEKFMVFVKVGVAGGLALAAPWIFYQLWGFVAPGLLGKEKKFLLPFIILGTVLFFGGCTFAYFFVVPNGLKFLMELGGSIDGAIITYSSYVNFLLMMMLVIGASFQVPLLLSIAVLTGLIEITKLRRARPYYYIGISVASAALTPPDPFTMVAMLIPSILLYEITLLLLSWKK